MKTIIYILTVLIPGVVCAQRTSEEPSLLDYTWMNVGNSCFTVGRCYGPCLAFNSSGLLRVAFVEKANSFKPRE